MSDNTNPTIEQAVESLRSRAGELADEWEIVRRRLIDIEARQDELRQAIDTLTHVRPKRGRPKGSTNSVAPPPTQPGGYDDSVSIGEARGILNPPDGEALPFANLGPNIQNVP